MYKVIRRFIRESDSLPPCVGYYEYKIQEVGQDLDYHWMSEKMYLQWKNTVIDENFT